MSKEREPRYYTYTFELYEESVPQNYIEIIQNFHTKAALIWHDKDVYSQSDYDKYLKNNNTVPNWKVGDRKKIHAHIVIKFNSLKTTRQILQLVEMLGVKYVEPVLNEYGMIRYLIHLDDKDKAQYKKEDIKLFCNYNIDSFFESDEMDKDIMSDIRLMSLEDEEWAYDYSDFYTHILLTKGNEYANQIEKHSTHFNYFLRSKRNRRDKRIQNREIELTEQNEQRIREKYKNIVSDELQNKKASLDSNELKNKIDIEKLFIENEKDKELIEIIGNEYKKEREEKIMYLEALEYIKKYEKDHNIKNKS